MLAGTAIDGICNGIAAIGWSIEIILSIHHHYTPGSIAGSPRQRYSVAGYIRLDLPRLNGGRADHPGKDLDYIGVFAMAIVIHCPQHIVIIRIGLQALHHEAIHIAHIQIPVTSHIADAAAADAVLTQISESICVVHIPFCGQSAECAGPGSAGVLDDSTVYLRLAQQGSVHSAVSCLSSPGSARVVTNHAKDIHILTCVCVVDCQCVIPVKADRVSIQIIRHSQNISMRRAMCHYIYISM